jgi:hypothetical protein
MFIEPINDLNVEDYYLQKLQLKIAIAHELRQVYTYDNLHNSRVEWLWQA